MAKVPPQYAKAIARYGPSVNALARRKYGISGQQLLARLTQGESGFRKNAVSSAGARGATQFMPATRAEYIKKYGVDAWKNADQAEHATALYLKGAGNIGAYNPGDKSYTSYILGQKVSGLNTSGRFPSASAGSKGGAVRTIPGQDNSGERRQLLLNYLLNGGNDPTGSGLLNTVVQIKQTPDVPSKTVKVPKVPGKSTATVSHKGGTTMIDGKPVANWIAKRLERARAAGWQGTVTSGYRSVAEQRRIYDSGVRPAAKPGQSNHNFTAFPGGAVDVSDPQQLARVLKKLGIKKLQWAGSKDVVHFSHPHNGSY